MISKSGPVLPAPERPEIDHRTIKLIVGVISLTLPILTKAFAEPPLTSISASYYSTGPAQSIFVGYLFATSAFLLAYNGRSRTEMVLSKVAAAAALGVALFPCNCADTTEQSSPVHWVSAASMFVILTYFCYTFRQRALDRNHFEAKIRAAIYLICGIAMLVSIAVLGADALSHRWLTHRVSDLVFWGETVSLIAFGVSWLTASRVLPLLTRPDERFSPFKERNPA